jgi:uncharacterized membrane protein YeaQ/YmgE (transglycosylase-associated protein family)
MPFTPLHLGPGSVFKAIGGRHFSFMVFGGAQVLMDIEPLIGMLRGWDVLHGYTHTLVGALLIGSIAGCIGKPISTWVLNWLKIPHQPITWQSSFLGAYVGTFSHILLDAIMHRDMSPWWPFSSGNRLLGLISVEALYWLCVITAVVGSISCIVYVKMRGRD